MGLLERCMKIAKGTQYFNENGHVFTVECVKYNQELQRVMIEGNVDLKYCNKHNVDIQLPMLMTYKDLYKDWYILNYTGDDK